MKQKITRPRVRILGTDYSPVIVGLHNRVRAHARRLLVYKDLRRLGGATPSNVRGLFVPGRRRLIIYLRRGAPEITVAHELTHAMLYSEGYLPLRCRRDDLAAQPELGMLASALNNLLVHPVVFDRLRRCGFREMAGTNAAARHPGDSMPFDSESSAQSRATRTWRASQRPDGSVLAFLAGAVIMAESMSREVSPSAASAHAHPGNGPPEVGALARRIAKAAPWSAARTPLQVRALAFSLVKRLDEAAMALFGMETALEERILMPAPLTKRRLDGPASKVFSVRAARSAPGLVLVAFRPDGAACSTRLYSDPWRAARVAVAVTREAGAMTAREFTSRHNLEYILLEGSRRYFPWRGTVRL